MVICDACKNYRFYKHSSAQPTTFLPQKILKLFLITESQNGWDLNANHLVPAFSSRATYCLLFRTTSRLLLSISKEGYSTVSLSNLLYHSVTQAGKTHVPHVCSPATHVFQFVPIASCSVTGHHSKEPGFILFVHSALMQFLQSFLFSTLNSPALSFSSLEMCSNPLIIFMVLFWDLSSMFMSLLLSS